MGGRTPWSLSPEDGWDRYSRGRKISAPTPDGPRFSPCFYLMRADNALSMSVGKQSSLPITLE